MATAGVGCWPSFKDSVYANKNSAQRVGIDQGDHAGAHRLADMLLTNSVAYANLNATLLASGNDRHLLQSQWKLRIRMRLMKMDSLGPLYCLK